MKNPHWKYFVLLILFTYLLDLALGTICKSQFFSNKSMKNDPLNHAVLGTNEDILIFGSSRAKHHYNPTIFEETLGMTCYNVGEGGQNIYYHLALLEATLERYTPKIVILELMTIDFEVTPPQWDTEKLGRLLPFYHKSEVIKKAVLRRGKSEVIKTLFHVYPFNSLQYTTFRNNFLPFNNHINGFIPINRFWNKKLQKQEIAESNQDPQKIRALYHFIEQCKTNQIEVFVLVSPHYTILQGKNQYGKIAKQFKKKFGIDVINYENDQFFLNHSELFADPLHLNQKGASMFSALISKLVFKKLGI